MTTAKKTAWSEWQTANLSQYHAGQNCCPRVAYRKCGGSYHAKWSWVNRSDGSEYGQGEAKGTYHAVNQALRAEGIRTDDHKF